MHCHLHRGDWSFHLTNEKKKNPRSAALEADVFFFFFFFFFAFPSFISGVHLGHERQDLLRPCDEMHVCTDYTSVYTLIRKSFWGNGA